MDPQQPSSFSHRVERLSTGKTYHFIDEKPKGFNERTVTLLCVHGFPDLWYIPVYNQIAYHERVHVNSQNL
jgi:soluble epoxide hydrolase / lipid-phosphate phosphatase